MRTATVTIRSILLYAALFIGAGVARAGPPYLTDDPDPVPLHHWELYTFEMSDRAGADNTVDGPALEINNGVAPNTQIHVIVPQTYFSQDGVSARGLGDTEIGVKYRFLAETRSCPEVGAFPLAELPTGDQSKGLGNGRPWFKLPIWLQKSWGPWTTYGGGGYAANSAPGMGNYGFGGLLVQRALSSRWTLGGELFLEGAQVSNEAEAGVFAGARPSAIWNFGGSYNFTSDFSLLFSAGRSYQGDGNAVTYLALYRTWGQARRDDLERPAKP